MTRYRAVFSRTAFEAVVRMDSKRFREMRRWIDAVEKAPMTPGDYMEFDSDKREMTVVVLDSIVVTFWRDDAACEIRVVEIESL